MVEPQPNDVPQPAPETPDLRASPNTLPETIFADANGLRPVWRVLIYACGYYLLRSLLLFVAGAALSSRAEAVNELWLLLFEECLLLIAAVAPAIVLSKLDGRSFGSYGLPAREAFGKHFWAGALWGLAAITVLLIAMRGFGILHFEGLALHGARIFEFALFWGAFFLVVGAYEDFLFRGYSLITLSEAIGFWPAALLLSFTFGGIHLLNRGETWIGALGAAFIGLFFSLTLRRTGTLWFAVGVHAAWDWGESFLYSVPDSGIVVPRHLLRASLHGAPWLTGGSVGPEGSVLLFVLIAVMWIGFDRVYPAKQLSPDRVERERERHK